MLRDRCGVPLEVDGKGSAAVYTEGGALAAANGVDKCAHGVLVLGQEAVDSLDVLRREDLALDLCLEVGQVLQHTGDDLEDAAGALVRVAVCEPVELGGHDGRAEQAQEQEAVDDLAADRHDLALARAEAVVGRVAQVVEEPIVHGVRSWNFGKV